jgi:hypothetical protein
VDLLSTIPPPVEPVVHEAIDLDEPGGALPRRRELGPGALADGASYLSATAPHMGAIRAEVRDEAERANPDHVAKLPVTSIDLRRNGMNGVTSVKDACATNTVASITYRLRRQVSICRTG